MDDSGARHEGKNGYVTHIGNECFAWFKSTAPKSRLNFLDILRAGHKDYCLSVDAILYMEQQKLPLMQVNKLRPRIGENFENEAGQFNILQHALCWIHAERLVHKTLPLNEQHRQEIAHVRDQIWTLYTDLIAFKDAPEEWDTDKLAKRFDQIITLKTGFATLNQLLKRIHANMAELLRVLERPEIRLYTNGSETNIRDCEKNERSVAARAVMKANVVVTRLSV